MAQTTLGDAAFSIPVAHRCVICGGSAPVGKAPNQICNDCLDRVREEDREAEYDDYAAYLKEKLSSDGNHP